MVRTSLTILLSSYVFFLCFPFSPACVYGHIVHVHRQVSAGY
jgi:hypothetical protein